MKATLLSVPVAVLTGLILLGTTLIAVASVTPSGAQVSPLSSVTTFPDGGSSYNYQISGGNDVTLSFRTPPEDFDPSTASASELALYGFPPRPSAADAAALAIWTAQADRRSYATPPNYVTSNPASRNATACASGNNDC